MPGNGGSRHTSEPLAGLRQAPPDLSGVSEIAEFLEQAEGLQQGCVGLVLVADELLRPGEPLEQAALAIFRDLGDRMTEVTQRVGLGHSVTKIAEDGQGRL